MTGPLTRTWRRGGNIRATFLRITSTKHLRPVGWIPRYTKVFITRFQYISAVSARIHPSVHDGFDASLTFGNIFPQPTSVVSGVFNALKKCAQIASSVREKIVFFHVRGVPYRRADEFTIVTQRRRSDCT